MNFGSVPCHSTIEDLESHKLVINPSIGSPQHRRFALDHPRDAMYWD